MCSHHILSLLQLRTAGVSSVYPCFLAGKREPGARLMLRLFGHLWIPSEQPQPSWYDTTAGGTVASDGQPCSLKYSCDRHLLMATQDNLLVPALLFGLKVRGQTPLDD